MEAEFWHNKWHSNDIGFDQAVVNPLLAKYFSSLNRPAPARILVPLCGKSIDMVWLTNQGHHVIGIELNQDAIEQFFAAQKISPNIKQQGAFIHYSAPLLDLYVGDFFAASTEQMGGIDAVYDRASLVALPKDMRTKYTEHLVTISAAVPQLLITFDYDQSLQAGPPFAISHDEVGAHYGDRFDVKLLASVPVKGGLKGGCDANEEIWLLMQK